MIHKRISWNIVGKLVANLEKQIKESKKKYDFIIGLNRGGLIPSVMLSHKLGIIHGVHTVQSYNGTEKREIKSDLYISMIGFIKPHHNVLLVDDIAESGESLKVSMEKIRKKDSDIKNIDIATLYYKPKSIIVPTYYAKKISNEIWIDFAWECEEK